jgi:hypothetical protein
MTRDHYLKLKYGPNGAFLNMLRTAVLVVFAVVLGGVIYNLSLAFWTGYQLILSQVMR